VPKFPEPDISWLAEIGPTLHALEGDSLWWRIYYAGGSHPSAWNTFRNYGPVATGRFDHHLPPSAMQARRSFYAGSSIGVCVAEVFQDRRRVHFDGEPRLAALTLARPVEVLDLRGLWPTRAGASQAVSSGSRSRSRRWARAIANTFHVEGLIYRSSMHSGDDAVVLWDCPDALTESAAFDEPLRDARFAAPLRRLATTLGYSVA